MKHTVARLKPIARLRKSKRLVTCRVAKNTNTTIITPASKEC
jgi:hypothetical protein